MQFITISFGIHLTDLQYEGYEGIVSKQGINQGVNISQTAILLEGKIITINCIKDDI